MRVTWSILALVGACSFEHGKVPGDAAPDTTDADTTDTDGDGVADVADNCPTFSNANQRDHDLDMRGDACDRCPHLASTADPDSDADGIGDDCDPRPMVAGDLRMLWEGFDDASALQGWSSSGAAWTVSNGAVGHGSTVGDSRLVAPAAYQRVYVATAFQVNGIGSNASVGFCSGVTGSSQYYCCLLRGGGPSFVSVSYSSPTINDTQGSVWSGPFASGERFAFTQNQSAGNRCSAQQGVVMNTKTAMLGPSAGALELYTRDAAASFDYLFVVEIGP